VLAIGDRLRQYAQAIADPTRGMIVLELDQADELTATQLARRLDLTANNVYHHMRVLLNAGVVDTPRAVPGDTYVEKYYRLNPELRAALRLDQKWFEDVGNALDPADRQALVAGVCMTMSQLLRRAAFSLGAMDAATFDRYLDERRFYLSINRLGQTQMAQRLKSMRELFDQEDRAFAEDTSPRSELMIIAGLPLTAE
jgi:DNA-binding transcriptional ArsR family regulator